jgi:RimJ/RimL family protein N-acetyltransferase
MLRTDRLLLRSWRPVDRQAFARMNADSEVTEFFVAPLRREESDAFVDRIEAGFAVHGFGVWAVEEISTGAFIGLDGLLHQTFEASFTPAFEIGYRLARHAWGHGYATEAAREAVRFGFENTGLVEIVSMTAVGNVRSRAVMDKLDVC